MPSTSLTLPLLALIATAAARSTDPKVAAVCQGSGGFKCVDQFHFTLCNGDYSVSQSVAPGTQCVNDQITMLRLGPGGFANSTALSSNATQAVVTTATADVPQSTTLPDGDDGDNGDDDDDGDDGDESDDSDGSGVSSPSSSAPFAIGNSTASAGPGTGIPFFPKTFTTKTTKTTARAKSSSSSASQKTTSKPAITTPGSGIPSGLSTVTLKDSPSPPSSLDIVPVTSMR